MDWRWEECPYSTKTREVLGNPSPPPLRFPSRGLPYQACSQTLNSVSWKWAMQGRGSNTPPAIIAMITTIAIIALKTIKWKQSSTTLAFFVKLSVPKNSTFDQTAALKISNLWNIQVWWIFWWAARAVCVWYWIHGSDCWGCKNWSRMKRLKKRRTVLQWTQTTKMIIDDQSQLHKS